MGKDVQKVDYDAEWIRIIRKAKKMGLTPAEVRVLLNKVKRSSQVTS